jgi:cellulose synthase/poly-beta-1,6-N-acetylglucosamine synthase-like glycosyltransferase
VTTGQRVTYRLLLFVALGSMAAFAWWWLDGSHVPSNFAGRAHIVDYVLFALLTATFSHRAFMDVFSWLVALQIGKPVVTPPPPNGVRVAFITTFVPGAETVELLRETLTAIVAVDYPHDTWVLDEGDDPVVRELCAQVGVGHFSRSGTRRYNQVAGPFTRRTKGGNHNAWYHAHGDRYDVVAQIDTDFTPRRDFLTQTLGHFRDPDVGFVGTPQVYGNERDSLVARGASQQLYMFYGAIMRGLSARGMCTMIGANHVVRVEALRDVGYYAGHLTEDLITGMRLHARGWRSVYVGEPLAVGEAPATWRDFFNQQMRWAFGCVDILRRHSLHLVNRMERRQALLYLALQQHYFSGVAMATGVGLLLTYFIGGIFPADVALLPMLAWGVPVLLVRQLVMLWLQRFNADPEHQRGLLFAGRYLAGVSWPIYLLACIGVLRRRRLVFKVTPKGTRRSAGRTPIGMLAPHVVTGLVVLTAMVFGIVRGHTALPLLAWGALTVALMLSFAAILLWRPPGAPRRGIHRRRDVALAAQPGISLMQQHAP